MKCFLAACFQTPLILMLKGNSRGGIHFNGALRYDTAVKLQRTIGLSGSTRMWKIWFWVRLTEIFQQDFIPKNGINFEK